jgi:hypothetical protein
MKPIARLSLIFVCTLLLNPTLTALYAAPNHLLHTPGSLVRFLHLAQEDGLSQNAGLAFLQDSRGFVWIGTQDGLNRYDGHTFTVYKNDPDDPNSLSHNSINALMEDRDGQIWIGTWGGGLNRVEEKSTETVNVTRPSRIVVETFNGNIEVVTGADDKVAVEVTKFTDSGRRDVLKDIEFSLSQDAQAVTVKARWPDERQTSPGITGADLKVSVPAGSPVQATVGNGNITYRGTPGEGNSSFEVGNGHIIYDAALGQGKYDLGVGNGSIELQLPADAQFSIDASVGNGNIANEYPVTDTASDERVLKGSVGSHPQASITAASGNGSIKVQRSN